MHVHSDLSMTAKQSQLEAGWKCQVSSARELNVASPLEGLAVKRLLAGCEGTTPRALIRRRKIGTCKAGTAARFATEMPQKLHHGEYSSTIWGAKSGPRRAADAAPCVAYRKKGPQKTGKFYAIFLLHFWEELVVLICCRHSSGILK